MGLISGKFALVTGAAKRIGREISLELAKEGVNIIVHYRNSEAEAKKVCDEVSRFGVNAWLLRADFHDRGEIESVMDRAFDKTGKIDFLINNASIFPWDSLKDMAYENVVENLKVNAWAPFVLCRKFAERAQSGKIINLLDSRTAGYDWAHVSYILSKHVLTALTNMMALEYAPKITVNGVAPGLILPPPGQPESYLDNLVKTVPLQKSGEPYDIAQAVIYLLESKFVTGNVIYVDGGRHLWEYVGGQNSH